MQNPPYKICPSCQEIAAARVVACGKCGYVYPKPPKPWIDYFVQPPLFGSPARRERYMAEMRVKTILGLVLLAVAMIACIVLQFIPGARPNQEALRRYAQPKPRYWR